MRLLESGGWHIELLPRSGYEASYTPSNAVIGYAFDGQTGTHAFARSRRVHFRSPPNGLAYIPAGCDVYSSSKHGGEYLRVMRTDAGSGQRETARRFSDVIDMFAIEAATRMRRELLSGCPELLVCEHLAYILASRVDTWINADASGPIHHRWMTPSRLRIIDDLIEANLATKLTVHGLARALGLSDGFFTRAFKAATGQSPHDYIIDRRVSRARVMMRDNAIDLATVALLTGFSSHAHMTSSFRRRLSLSPTELRNRK
jgi:AraC family transcriptional regulator